MNDLELQRHLLIHRFGFNPQDIYTLTDKQATRQGILEAFEEHLIKQAKPGDVRSHLIHPKVLLSNFQIIKLFELDCG